VSLTTIFTLKGSVPTITAEGLSIPAFKDIWDSDKSSQKEKAFSQLAYIYHCSDPRSPFSSIHYKEREPEVRATYFTASWKPTKAITAAIEVYAKLLKDPQVRLLEAARQAADKLTDYFKIVDFTLLDSKRNLVYNPKDVVGSLKVIGDVISSLEQLEERMHRGFSKVRKIRGDVKPSAVLDD